MTIRLGLGWIMIMIVIGRGTGRLDAATLTVALCAPLSRPSQHAGAVGPGHWQDAGQIRLQVACASLSVFVLSCCPRLVASEGLLTLTGTLTLRLTLILMPTPQESVTTLTLGTCCSQPRCEKGQSLGQSKRQPQRQSWKRTVKWRSQWARRRFHCTGSTSRRGQASRCGASSTAMAWLCEGEFTQGGRRRGELVLRGC